VANEEWRPALNARRYTRCAPIPEQSSVISDMWTARPK
jgi:hypothetical protein